MIIIKKSIIKGNKDKLKPMTGKLVAPANFMVASMTENDLVAKIFLATRHQSLWFVIIE